MHNLFTITPSTNPLFDDFLLVEYGIFGNEYPLAASDPKLNLPTLYRFALGNITFPPGYTTVVVGKEYTLLALYLAFRGGIIVSVGDEAGQTRRERFEKAAAVVLAWHSQTDLANIAAETADRLVAFSPTQTDLAESLRVLKPGGTALINYAAGRAPELTSQAGWRISKKQFICDKMPLETLNPHEFADFWQKTLTSAERQKWAWASALFADVFNNVSDTPDNAHTVLYILEKA